MGDYCASASVSYDTVVKVPDIINVDAKRVRVVEGTELFSCVVVSTWYLVAGIVLS